MKVKKYFKDYAECMRVCNKFNKEHWLGNIIFSVALLGAEFGILYAIDRREDIKDWIAEKRLSRVKVEEVDE